MPAADWIVIRRAGHLARQFLERLALRLGDEQGGEDAEQHEEREDLHHVVEPRGGGVAGGARGCAARPQRAEDGLCNDGANLARRGREAVRRRAIAGGEAFARHDERGCVGAYGPLARRDWKRHGLDQEKIGALHRPETGREERSGTGTRPTEVEEKLSEHVQRQECAVVLEQPIVREPDADENDRKHDEAHHLNRFAADGIHQCHCDPVPRNRAGADDDQITDSGVVEDLVHRVSFGEADGGQDDGIVQAKPIKRHVQGEPRARCSQQNLAMLPLAVVAEEVSPTRLGDFEAAGRILKRCHPSNLIRMSLGSALDVGFGVLTRLFHIAGDIERVTGCFRNGQSIVQSDAARDRTKADDDAPHLVHSDVADAITPGRRWG